MLRFFRQIRQRLLIQNKFSIYLLYAIGEILLVVIGILIALQVDNWNEERKERVFANELLEDVLISVRENMTYLNIVIESNQTGIKSGEIISLHLERDLPYHDSLNIHFSHAVGYSTPILRNAGYESLKSYGLNIIENDSILKSLEILNNGFIETLVLRQENYFSNTASPILTGLFETVTMRTGMKPFNYEELKKSRKYRSILNTSIANKKDANSYYKIWLLGIEDLYKRIDQELKKSR